MYRAIKEHLQKELEEIKEAGLYKSERIITSSQDAVIKISTGEEVINFCANNYLGLSNNPEVIQAAKDTMDTHGFGMSSVRFICGTQDIHKNLEAKLQNFIKQKTPFYMLQLLMPMEVFLNLYCQKKMRSFQIV